MKINIRNYRESDFDAIERIHDTGRRTELRLAGLEEAFLPLRIAAEREGLFEYPGLLLQKQTVPLSALQPVPKMNLRGCMLMFLCFAAA